MEKNLTGQSKTLGTDDVAFDFPVDLSEIKSKASIILGVEHHILRPDEWLLLRTVDWFQNLISVFLGTWIIGFINVIIKLLMEHDSEVKVKKLDINEFWFTLALFITWVICVFLYRGRVNQKWKFTQIDRQYLVDEIDSKLRLKFKRNG